MIIPELEKFSTLVNNELNPVTSIAIDPGKANGFCGYDERHYVQFSFTVAEEQMIEFLETFNSVTTCVIEDFKLFPNKTKQQIYSDMETSRVIGRVESWAIRKKVNLIKQPSSIKPNGYAWIGKKPLPKHNPQNHALDAHVHFMYWAIKNGKIDPASLMKRSNPTRFQEQK